MEKVCVAEHPMEAQLLCGYLAGAGIDAQVRGLHLFTLRGGLPLGEETLPSIWVPVEQADLARQLLRHAEMRGRLSSVQGSPDERDHQGPPAGSR
jgi:hypothetical protein